MSASGPSLTWAVTPALVGWLGSSGRDVITHTSSALPTAVSVVTRAGGVLSIGPLCRIFVLTAERIMGLHIRARVEFAILESLRPFRSKPPEVA